MRGIFIFTIIVGFYSVLTNARYIMAGFVLVLLQVLLTRVKIKKINYLLTLGLVFFVIYFVLTDVVGINFQQFFEKRLFAEGSIENTTRYGGYINFLRFFPQKPI